MKKLLLISFIISSVDAFPQDWPVKRLITDRINQGGSFPAIPAFRFVTNKTLGSRGTYQEIQLDRSFIGPLMAQRPAAIEITIPLSRNESITCQLVKSDLGNMKFTENNNKTIGNIRMPLAYRGIISGEIQKNNVILTINDDYISLVATFNDRTLQIAQADAGDPLTYRLYNSILVQFPTASFDCGNKDPYPSQTPNGILLNGVANRPDSVQKKCVYVFVDCFDSLFLKQDSSQQKTINYVIELFNLVATGYLNDTVNVRLLGINIWTLPDPFRQDNSSVALADLGYYHKDNFYGNLCVGLDYGTGRGGLAWLGRTKGVLPNTCPTYNSEQSSGAFSYCDLNFGGSFQGFPVGPSTTQGQVAVMMHEMGHQLGVNHTHWCGWQVSTFTTGAIDNCAPVEGACQPGPPPPASGGTIMSYCHLTAGFTFYNNGFGTLPGNALRNFVDQTSCIPNCVNCSALLYLKPDTQQSIAIKWQLPAGDEPLPPGKALDYFRSTAAWPARRKEPGFRSF